MLLSRGIRILFVVHVKCSRCGMIRFRNTKVLVQGYHEHLFLVQDFRDFSQNGMKLVKLFVNSTAHWHLHHHCTTIAPLYLE